MTSSGISHCSLITWIESSVKSKLVSIRAIALIQCAIPPEVPVVSMEKATKCVDYNGAAARHPELELF
ncbi:hypothetical protein Tco_0286078 [Tanacetum coccineum]